MDCCDPLGGVAPGVEATDWDALNDPIRDCDMVIPWPDPILPCEYDIGKLGRDAWWLLEAMWLVYVCEVALGASSCRIHAQPVDSQTYRIAPDMAQHVVVDLKEQWPLLHRWMGSENAPTLREQ